MSFNGLEVGKRSLTTNQRAMGVTGHNISNANKEGYSRQTVEMNTLSNQHPKFGAIGIGSEVEQINRVRNSFIDDRMIKEKSTNSKWETREINLKHMEYIINEPSDQSIRRVLDEYWEAMQDLSQNPEDMATRVSLKERAEALSNSVSSTYERFEALKADFDNNIEVMVNNINSITKRMAEINGQIRRVEAGGGRANDLRDEFDFLTEKLSEQVNVKVSRKGREYAVSIGGRTVVQDDFSKDISIRRDQKVNEGLAQLYWEDIDEPVLIQDGTLKGLLELRDEDAVKYMRYMDQLAIGIIDATNDVNQAGFDYRGVAGGDFFNSVDSFAQVRDVEGAEIAAVYKLRGSLAINNNERPISEMLSDEQETVNEEGVSEIIKSPYEEKGTFEINGVKVNYDTKLDSMDRLVEKINKAKAGVVANVGPNGRLIIRAEKEEDYYVKTLNQEQGTLLTKLGILKDGQAFDFRDSATINVLTEDRKGSPRDGAARRMSVAINNVENIAAARGIDTDGDGIADRANPVGDGSNALRMATLKGEKSIGRFTYDEFFKSVVSDLGISSQEAKKYMENQKILMNNLEQRREAEQGVSLDEEMANMIKYQHGYDAAARYIRSVDDMVKTVIEKL
jgi:flagellar hook-associated protein 1 FlgK